MKKNIVIEDFRKVIRTVAVIFLILFTFVLIYFASSDSKRFIAESADKSTERVVKYPDTDIVQNHSSEVIQENLSEEFVSSEIECADTSKQAECFANEDDSQNALSGSSTEPKAKQKVWVVDSYAWTETVKIPIYSSKPVWFICFEDGTKKKYYDKKEWIAECNNAPGVVQWGSERSEEYISGYEDEYIEHPEQGHWEYKD